jgi:acyl carrier protein
VIQAWRELLEIPQPGDDDNFFLLGGNSLMAAALVGAIEDRLSIEFPMQTLFFDGRLVAVIEECERRLATV